MQTFTKTPKSRYYSAIRDYLRSHGVFVKKDGNSIAANLIECRDRPEYYEWSDEEVRTQLKISPYFYSRYSPARKEEIAALERAYQEKIR